MFDLFDGLPVHALVVHAVVVLAPLTALLAVIYAVAPARRLGLRWPLALLAVATGVTGFVAGESGEKLEHRLGGGNATLHEHTEAGDLLKIACVIFMVLVLLAVFVLLRADRTAPARSPLAIITAVVLVLASVGVCYQTVVTGHTGARAVWGDQITP